VNGKTDVHPYVEVHKPSLPGASKVEVKEDVKVPSGGLKKKSSTSSSSSSKKKKIEDKPHIPKPDISAISNNQNFLRVK
jgi:hypothetical protein